MSLGVLSYAKQYMQVNVAEALEGAVCGGIRAA